MSKNNKVTEKVVSEEVKIEITNKNAKDVSMSEKDTPILKTLVDVIMFVSRFEICKNKNELVEKVLSKCKEIKLTHNARGKEIQILNIKSLSGAIMRDITTGRKGWWTQFKVLNDETQLKILVK